MERTVNTVLDVNGYESILNFLDKYGVDEKLERETPISENSEERKELNLYDSDEASQKDSGREAIQESGEDVTSPYSNKGKKQLNYIKDLYMYFASHNFQYGYKDSDGNLISDDDYDTIYKLQSPDEFEKSKTGICWDYAIYEEYKLRRLHVPCQSYFVELATKENCQTHTFVIAKIDEWYIYIEYSFEKIRGIYRSKSAEDLIYFVVNAMMEDFEETSALCMIHTYKNYTTYGVSTMQFMKAMRDSKMIKKVKLQYSKNASFDVVKIYGYQKDENGKGLGYFEESSRYAVGENLLLQSMKSESAIAYMEGAVEEAFHYRDLLAKKIETVLTDPKNDRKLRKIISDFIDRNMDKLTTSGPVYLIVFGSTDQQMYYELFQLSPEQITKATDLVIKSTGSASSFKLLRGNPIFVLLYYIIRYYTIKNDKRGVNNVLSIYAIAVYWSIYSKYFPHGVIEPIMQFTIDNLTDKFLIKKCNHIFGVLTESIQRSYEFHKSRIKTGTDKDCVDFIQRIRNDQNSLIKKIANEYMKNYQNGNAISTRNDNYDPDNPILDDIQNATTVIQYQVDKTCLPIISNGVDIVLAEACAKMAGISVSDTRLYLIKIMVPKNLPILEKLIESILFLFIYEDKRSVSEIKSRYFLTWAASIFKKTNSKDKNIGRINAILEQWAEESGIYERFKREASRIGYKKAIFFYVVLSIQKYS